MSDSIAHPVEADPDYPGALLVEAVNRMSLGLIIFDKKREIVFCNLRYIEIYGLSPEQVKPGTPISEMIQHRLTMGLKVLQKPDEYIRERIGSPVVATTTVQEFANGRVIAYTAYPMPDGGGLATHEDITEREAMIARLKQQQGGPSADHEEALRIRNLQFDMAINNMSQGLCFFDAAQRLIVCNQRYIEMYDLPPDRVTPGMLLSEIVDMRFEAGSFPAMSREEYLHWRTKVAVSADPTDSIVELRNGRTFKIRHRPMPTFGWVATHEDITEQRQAEIKIEYMAHHDALTGLGNRVLLNQRLESALDRVVAPETLAVHHLDLDQFKAVNDTFGHAAGDKLLKIVAERLRGLVRDSDTIARMGGDEFVIVQVPIAEAAEATFAGATHHRRDQRTVRPRRPSGGDRHQRRHRDQPGRRTVCRQAAAQRRPRALSRQGPRPRHLPLLRAGDGSAGADPPGHGTGPAAGAAGRRVRALLPAGGRSSPSNEISGFEALIRWNHPKHGLVAPAAFIPLAEEIGFIIPMGEWVIRQACATAAHWPGELRVAVNISAAQFRNSGLLQVIVGALSASGLPPTRLEIEITETVLLQNRETTLAALHQLRALGIRIAMDDFGTGYSSLTYLQSFPFDKIKIDRSFVKDIDRNTGSLNIVRAVAALASGLGMTATAEGVETHGQLAQIVAAGCNEMQGYLFSQPLPAAEIEQLFLSQPEARKASRHFAAA